MPRRDGVPIEHRERIVRAFEDEAENYLLMADALGVNRSTARGIVASEYLSIWGRPRGSRKNVLADDEMRQCIKDIINDICVLPKPDKWGVEDFMPNLWFMTGPLLEIWKPGMLFSRVNWLGPSQQTEIDVMFCKEGKNMETGSWTMTLCATVFLSTSAVTTSGLREITGGRGSVSMRIESMRPARTERDHGPSSITC